MAVLVAALAMAVAGLAWLSVAYTDGGTVVDLDVRVADWVAAHMPDWAEWIARVFSWVGGAVGLAPLCIVAVALLWRAGRGVDALFVAIALVVVQILVAVLKGSFERARPEVGSAVPLPHSYAFPSGHAADSVVFFGAVAVVAADQLESGRARVALYACAAGLALAIGSSRVVLNVHYVSDVLAGWCLGVATLCLCLLVRRRLIGHSPRTCS